LHVVTRGGGQLPALESRHGVHVHRVTEPEFPRDVEQFLLWVRQMNRDMARLGGALARTLGVDLVHSHDWLVADAARRVARTAGLPWVVTVHATEYGRHQGWVRKPPQSKIHAAERRMARGADHVITCSDYMAGHVAQIFGVAPARITAIPNGIDAADLVVAPAPELTVLRARFAAPDERLVLLVGRLVYEKGFHLALDALAALVRAGQPVRFVVAGSGMAERELKSQARKLGLTRHGSFLGWTGDDLLHCLYRVADLCIVPSIYEPFGLVALEAMASGCLCVVADTGGLRELIPADGTAGLRFACNDADALAQLLAGVLTDDRARMQLVAEAREHVLRFDWTEVARRTLSVYTAVAAHQPAATP
jgi:glycogen(starch) synthase